MTRTGHPSSGRRRTSHETVSCFPLHTFICCPVGRPDGSEHGAIRSVRMPGAGRGVYLGNSRTIKAPLPGVADRGAAKGTSTIHIDYSTSIQKCKEKHMYYYNGAGQRYELPERPLEPEENRYETVRNR